MKWYRLDTTGFSNGISWFKGSKRYETFGEVKEAYDRVREGYDDLVKWRIAEVFWEPYREDEYNPNIVTREMTEERFLYL